AFGVRAVDLLAEGAQGRMVAWQHRQVVDVSLAEVNARVRPVGLDDTLVITARGLGICLGD
ncbi:MAG: 6-phosphofructokinase, partial [Rhodospirillaceae bacterium]|nr:6-phosphofructokinase [Rhodospirillaceae bacterium]